ncbi:MAG: cytochrome C, partial [Gammaproteobacteria bacterium]|nr:cytochrome C [Gammaproteobacteria bacterium]
YWPITHMVAPKEDALTCDECHVKEGRLKDLEGFYLPGSGPDHGIGHWLDIIGLLAVAGTLFGVLGHGLIRFVFNKARKQS